mmetsp:Transcript_10867/g.15839  ORF Transcript_10867/g.15839 Transcript_10867/m.15839 type:complete len:110 (-) Transcript_10867:217-546(-)
MIINGMTAVFTLIIIILLGFIGLRLIRQFAFSIALENHEANHALDTKEDKARRKKIELADKAASDAFRKVEPLIKKSAKDAVGSAIAPPVKSPVEDAAIKPGGSSGEIV